MQKIAILGGGIGALATAAEITNAPDWQQHFDITIYQMGWRLGGKGASGRNRDISDRIQEHGIHLWMGFYENAFQLIRQVYDEANRNRLMPTSPFTDARKAFSPMNFTPMMEQVGKDWKLWNLNWPASSDFPGEASTFEQHEQPPTPLGFVKMLLDRITSFLDEKKDRHPILVSLYQDVAGHLCSAIGGMALLPAEAELPGEHTALHCITSFVHTLAEDASTHLPAIHLQIAKSIKEFNGQILKLVVDEIEKDDELRRFFILVDTGLSVITGMLEDRVVQEGFMAIEDYDMIDWLTRHGCHDPASPITLGMYDACFGYENGDPNKRRMGAGSTLYGALRLMFTYRGALMWWMNAGMGETIMSPLYLVLKNRGVKFKFFHKVKALHLSEDKKSIGSVELEIQANPKNGDYDPLFLGVDGVPCWPTQPFYEQLVEGDAIGKCQNPDLESWWTDWKGQPATLTRGTGFDLLVLGIPPGAHPYICQELISASMRWKNMIASVGLVRTQGLQLWMNKSLLEAGWSAAPGVLSGYVEPFDTWSDMSHLLPRERWPESARASQVAYFCNAVPDQPLAPFDDPAYPATQREIVKRYARNFLDGPLLSVLPATEDKTNPGHFDDAALVKCIDDPDQSAFDTQFFRCNIDPSELYTLSLPGSAKTRLLSHDSDFDNLFLAGDWTLTDLNIGCIEATVISARMASRAICGKPDHIVGAFGGITPIAESVSRQNPG